MDTQVSVAPACLRTGMCCQSIMLHLSPRTLREVYRNWRDEKPDSARLEDIYLIYPMLEGKCRGKIQTKYGTKYIYGPCKNLGWEQVEERLVSICTIQNDKPRMCSGFPYYDTVQAVTMGLLPRENKGHFKGCGYNLDTSAGVSPDDYGVGRLLNLSVEEQ